MKRLLITALLCLACADAPAQAPLNELVLHHDELVALQGALPTDTMSYQGELLDNGQPVEGPVDLRFEWWSAPDGGTSFGSVTVLAVPVAAGRFGLNVPTTFPDSGQLVFMAVLVNRNQPPGFVLLGRQQLVAAPFAVYSRGAHTAQFAQSAQSAQSAATAANATLAQTATTALGPWLPAGGSLSYGGNVGIGTTAPQAGLHVDGGTSAQPALFVREASGNGFAAVVESAAASGLWVRTLASAGNHSAVNATYAGGTGRAGLFHAESASGSARAVEALTASPDGFAGWFEGGRNYFGGSVGIGVSAPSDKLHVAAASGQPALRVQIDGATKLRVTSNGGVAIGANAATPADGLFVQGPILVPARTRWLTLDGRSFALHSSAWIEGQTVGTGGHPQLHRVAVDSRSDVWLSAAVNLPHGATVTELRLYARDNAPVVNMTATLVRRQLPSGASTTMASIATAGAVNVAQSPATSGISLPLIDNENNSYYVVANWDTGFNGADVDLTRLLAVRIAYTVNSPGP